MPDPHQFVLYVIAALLLAVTPGPGMFYVAARTLSGGRGEGIASSCGTGLGGMIHVVAGSLGASALVFASAQLFTALKLAGAVYLLWIGFQTFRSAGRRAVAPQGPSVLPATGTAKALRDGMLVEALNPKTAMFFLALIPQFVEPARGGFALQFLVLGVASVALNTLADIAVAFGAGRFREGAAAQPGLLRRMREGSGLLMIVLGLGLLIARRPVR